MAQTKRQHVFLLVCFVVIIFVVGPTQIAIELCQGEKPQFTDLFSQMPTRTNLRAFEKDLENASWLLRKLRPWIQYLRFVVLKDAGEKALLGRDNWFFYKPTVQYLIEPWPTDEGPGDKKSDIISAILDFRDQLAARGIQLLVMIAPNKASIYPDMLNARAGRTKQPVNAHTLKIISQLEQAEIEVVNLFKVFSRDRADQSSADSTPYYLSQDSHWSPRGAHLAAKAVAKEIFQLDLIEKGTIEYDLKTGTITRQGDVLRMMQVPQIERRFKPEQVHGAQVMRRDTGALYQNDPHSPILILGDSFLRIYEQDEPGSAGFIAHLARELKFPLASIVNDGGASTLVRQQLCRQPARLNGKRLVIWEFVERDIRFGTEGWQQVTLPRTVPVVP